MQISLKRGSCDTHNVYLHETMHALGFYHEQNRMDRDEHVHVVEDNVLPGK